MTLKKEEVCPKCGGKVNISCSSGGGLYECSFYAAICENCGVLADNFGWRDGTKRTAICEYNRWVRKQKKI